MTKLFILLVVVVDHAHDIGGDDVGVINIAGDDVGCANICVDDTGDEGLIESNDGSGDIR